MNFENGESAQRGYHMVVDFLKLLMQFESDLQTKFHLIGINIVVFFIGICIYDIFSLTAARYLRMTGLKNWVSFLNLFL